MTKRAVAIDDLYELRLVDDPDVSPCGTKVVFSVTGLDRDEDDYRSQIWMQNTESGELIPLTSGRYRDTRPQWSPDGEAVAFLSKRKDEDDDEASTQIYCMPVAGGEPQQVSNHDRSISSFEWAPDGRRMLFVANQRIQPTNDDTDVRLITTPRFRFDGLGYFDDSFKQVFVLDLSSGIARQLTDGPFDHLQATWAPNGNEIALSGNRREGWEFSSVRDIYLVKAESGHVRQLTGGDGQWSLPSWSPDGSRIAAVGTKNLTSASARNELFVIDVADGEVHAVTGTLDIDFRDSSISDWNGYGLDKPLWLGSDELLSVAGIRGNVLPVVVDISTSDHDVLGGDRGRYGHPKALSDGRFVATRSDFTDPGDLVVFRRGGEFERVTGFNRAWVDEVALVEPVSLTAESEDGEPVSGWLMRPPGIEDGESIPLVLEIHGGPFGMYGDTFMHEFQLLVAQGYAVVFANPRGSAGYGDRFADLLLPEMGINDLPDLMAIVDSALVESGLDGDRLGVLGGSYGGFMTNWVVAHTDRFRAAVTQRTISDWYSAWGTDDIFFADENVTLGATPWEDPELYFRISPLSYVDQMTTPMLIIHSEEDYRCPIPQGEQLFTALKRLGRTVEFVRVPDESHGLSRSGKPAHRAERLRHILRWFETYL